MEEKVINRFGTRVNTVEKDVREVMTKANRNTQEIQNIWDGINDIRKSISSMPWKFMGMIAVPTLLLIYQILNK